MKSLNLDLTKLLGFKIVANQTKSTEPLKISSKLGDKIGSGKFDSPKTVAKKL